MAYLVLFVALALSVVAAWYSVVGLMVLFAAAAIPVAIMSSTLEVAKLVTASWLYSNWRRVPIALKAYLSFAVFVLMFVTSLGIFGFLSKAHLDQAMPAGDISTKLEIVDQKIVAQQDLINSARTVLKQMDEAVNQSLGRGAGTLPPNATPAQIQAAQAAAERNTNAAATLRRNQQRERDIQQATINKATAEIQKLRDDRAPVAAQQRTLEAEVGPIKYVAELIWGADDAKSHFDSAVRFLIITLIFVFDPLAVLLVIAANMAFRWKREDKKAARLLAESQITDAVTAKPSRVEPQITDSVTSEPTPVNPQITDAVTQIHLNMGAQHDIRKVESEVPFVPRQEAALRGQKFVQPQVTEIESKVDLDIQRGSAIAAFAAAAKSSVDKELDKSIIGPLAQIPEEELKQALEKTDDDTLAEVYKRIVEDVSLQQQEDTLHRYPNSGAPPGIRLKPQKRNR